MRAGGATGRANPRATGLAAAPDARLPQARRGCVGRLLDAGERAAPVPGVPRRGFRPVLELAGRRRLELSPRTLLSPARRVAPAAMEPACAQAPHFGCVGRRVAAAATLTCAPASRLPVLPRRHVTWPSGRRRF